MRQIFCLRSVRNLAYVSAVVMLGTSIAGCAVDHKKKNEGIVVHMEIDACSIVTQSDASALFGNPASYQDSMPMIDPNMLGECIWNWKGDTSYQVLQFRVWSGDRYYTPASDSQSIALGEKGSVTNHAMEGLSIQWIRGGRVAKLNYGTTGKVLRDATQKIDDIKKLAAEIDSRL